MFLKKKGATVGIYKAVRNIQDLLQQETFLFQGGLLRLNYWLII